jgi:hypothetical protein
MARNDGERVTKMMNGIVDRRIGSRQEKIEYHARKQEETPRFDQEGQILGNWNASDKPNGLFRSGNLASQLAFILFLICSFCQVEGENPPKFVLGQIV